MKYLNYLVLPGILLVISAGLSARADPVSEIEAVKFALVEKFKTGEISEMVDLYTSNAVMLPPSSEILSNTESIKNYWDNLRQVGVVDYSIYQVALNIEGDLAYETALWEARRKTIDGNVITMDGNISSLFVKQDDGQWKIKLQSWN